MLLAFGGCSEIYNSDLSPNSEGELEIADSAYFVDKNTGDYSFVVIFENNSSDPIKEGGCSAVAFDEEGSQTMWVDYSLGAFFNWLGTGERTAYMFTTAIIPGESILDRYLSIPDSLEWELEEPVPDAELPSHGLSVAECTMTGDYDNWADYDVTIRNESETDYLYDFQSMMYQSDIADFAIEVVVVYRDADGNIKDAELIPLRPPSQKDIPANSEATMVGYSNHVCRDENLTPEYYISFNQCIFH